jgi:hypothetical protein
MRRDHASVRKAALLGDVVMTFDNDNFMTGLCKEIGGADPDDAATDYDNLFFCHLLNLL